MSFQEVGYRLLAWFRRFLEPTGLLSANRPPAAKLAVDAGCCDWINLSGIEDAPYLAAAHDLINGQESVFGVTRRSVSGRIDWNRDPLTGTRAPLTFGKLLNLNDRRVVGDIKYIWEPNRHYELVTLSQAFALSGNDSFLNALQERLESWLEQCPYPMGVNWSSALEVAIRLISWSLVWQFIGGKNSRLFAGDDGAGLLQRWFDSIYQHVHFIRSNYSRFSSANNHLIGEAAGVFVAACTWPFWREFEKWGADARNILIDTAITQTHPDGVNREQAVGYQQFVLDFFVLSALVGRSRRQEFPKIYWQKIERMMEYIPLLATGSILFNRSDFALKSGRLDDKTRFLLGDKGFLGLMTGECRQGDEKKRKFEDGGYYILGRDFDKEREIFLLVDSGPLGYLSIAAHGHADALAVYLSVAGREFLIDPGTYCYHGMPEWRAYFRGTRSHNTLVVDGEDQSVQGGPFLWTRHAKAICTRFEPGLENEVFVGEHDGYKRLRDPVIHQRQILRSGSEFEFVDTLKCAGRHSIERWWHFSERCTVTIEGSSVFAENDGIMIELVASNSSTKVVRLRGTENPIGGWVSRNYGAKVATTSVCFRDEIGNTSILSTRLACHLSGLE
jgi:hypothetical protein